ncbi:MAG: M1 family aminopeptidase, partial [Candidatus Heimdallarchaeaceae archaeon]
QLDKDTDYKENLELSISYEGELYNEMKEQGYAENYVGEEGSFANQFSFWYPRLDIENPKAKGKITFLVPKDIVVACNGKLVQEEKNDTQDRFVFEFKKPMIFAFGAAKYYYKTKNIEGIDIAVYLLKELESKANLYIEKASEMISFFKTKIYDSYPYDSYSIVEIPSEVAGKVGLSEEAMNFFSDSILPDNRFAYHIFAHELGHCWWGNWVGSKQKIVDEGLSQLCVLLYMEHFMGENLFKKFLLYPPADFFQSTFLYFSGIYNTEIEFPLDTTNQEGWIAHFTAVTKGSFVYLMLRDLIGEKSFYEGLKIIQKRYAHKTVLLRYIQEVMEEVSNQKLDWFFEQWFHRKGTPRFYLDYDVEEQERKYLVSGKIKQFDPFYKVSIDLSIVGEDKKKTEILEIDNKELSFSFTVDFEPVKIILDPYDKILRFKEEYANLDSFRDAALCLSTNKFAEGIEALNNQVNLDGDQLFARCWLANIYYQMGDVENAFEHLLYLKDRLNPKGKLELCFPGVCLMLGNIFDIKGERDRAIECYNSILETDRTKLYVNEAKKFLKQPFML